MIPKPKRKPRKRKRLTARPRGYRRTRSPLKMLEDKVWKLQSRMVRLRDAKCVICGAKEKLTQGHLISTKRAATRYDWQNVFCQCASCNFIHQFKPDIFTAWFIRKYGGSAYVELVERSSKAHKFTTEELEALEEHFELLIRDLEKIRAVHGGRYSGNRDSDTDS